MRRIVVALVASTLTLISLDSSEASPKASAVTAAFKTLLNTTADSSGTLDQKYEADGSALDDALAATTKIADSMLAQESQSATELYSPQILAVNQMLEASKTLF